METLEIFNQIKGKTVLKYRHTEDESGEKIEVMFTDQTVFQIRLFQHYDYTELETKVFAYENENWLE